LVRSMSIPVQFVSGGDTAALSDVVVGRVHA
jgi:hypothetical protein